MHAYEVLRNGLLEDKLISGQPAFAKEHLKKVHTASLCTEHMEMDLPCCIDIKYFK